MTLSTMGVPLRRDANYYGRYLFGARCKTCFPASYQVRRQKLLLGFSFNVKDALHAL